MQAAVMAEVAVVRYMCWKNLVQRDLVKVLKIHHHPDPTECICIKNLVLLFVKIMHF